jgi:hypothetical protein
MGRTSIKTRLTENVWFFCLLIGAIGTVLSLYLFPKNREESTLLQYVTHIIVFVIIITGIGLFPTKKKWLFILLTIPILIFNMYLAPRLTYFAEFNQYGNFYNLFFKILYPLFLCSIIFAYRIGGGKVGECIKIGLIGLLVLFSGVMDFMWFILNGFEYAKYATSIPHVQLIIGHVPKLHEMIIFMLVHLILSIAVLFVPFNDFFEKRLGRS